MRQLLTRARESNKNHQSTSCQYAPKTRGVTHQAVSTLPRLEASPIKSLDANVHPRSEASTSMTRLEWHTLETRGVVINMMPRAAWIRDTRKIIIILKKGS
jgi:hypothetical protein